MKEAGKRDSSKKKGSFERSQGGQRKTAGGEQRPYSRERILLNVDETAIFLGVSVWTIRRWVSQERIPFVKLGRAVRFDKEDLLALVDRCKVKPRRFGLGDHESS